MAEKEAIQSVVVPQYAVPPVIQRDLDRIVALRARIRALRQELKLVEAIVRRQLADGAEVAAGKLAARLLEVDHESPGWRKLSEKLLEIEPKGPARLAIRELRP